MVATLLRTRRLVLRPLELADVPRLAEVFADPETSRWLGRDLSRPEVVREWAEERTSASYPEGMGYLTFLLDGVVIGYGHLRPSHELPAPAVEIGWSIGRAHWGLGLAGEAARALLEHGFEGLGLPAVWALVRPENEPSLRLAGRLGFVEVASGVHYGAEHRVFVRLGETTPRVGALPRR
ncbi:GNAT family N-acetyltransferase [Crossiella cryophila]|uniref:RimJ/RimL family protein N-acetyltransferase n=1 Tax=Crossiella cryophila TaxID=43355 RepID=A0A7W7FX92_9PSEU|nr:GNAT family N-acetyltransferase [Crossiella cryophila]MBB4680885.1 RimJ/RimL family protein N-acetyltransferase [Crossiella cryophila]